MCALNPKISSKLKQIPEQQLVVGPIVELLVSKGWNLDQIVFGKTEWRVPKTPSEASLRSKSEKSQGFPVDIAVFETPEHAKNLDYNGLAFLVECKQPNDTEGLRQLEIYLSMEPHVRMGVWANNGDSSSEAVFVYKEKSGKLITRKKLLSNLPSPGSHMSPDHEQLTWSKLIKPSEDSLRRVIQEMLDRVVANDTNVTRREEQLDQLCNILLLKLDSDKQSRLLPKNEVHFKPLASASETAASTRKQFTRFIEKFPDIFTDEDDKRIRFTDKTVSECVDDLAPLNLIGLGPSVVSVAFQVLRSAALKQEEGQYFTPQPVIEAAVRFAGVRSDDLILDPACGTGGFLVECMMQMKEQAERDGGDVDEISRWAQKALHGIDKDAIAIKLTKAIMQILGDGSANCSRGDSVLKHRWKRDFPHLPSQFKDNRFTLIFTNPPFGAPLKIKRADAVSSGLTLADSTTDEQMELGLAMFNRCHQLLSKGGRLVIILPETYFFSPSYSYVREWAKTRFRPIAAINVPMDAFQGFCRAKTNIYVFEKTLHEDEASKETAKQDPEDQNKSEVTFLNPRTCGIYKNGGARYKVNTDGERTEIIDNELLDHVAAFNAGKSAPGSSIVPLRTIYENDVFVPNYYDNRWDSGISALCEKLNCECLSFSDLINQELIEVRPGHGSPGNDQRVGNVPYVKVSDIRSLRLNFNPTNMIPPKLAKKIWRGNNSGLMAWDLVTPNRASVNIGEFAMLLPGEEQVVLTKEVFVVRVTKKGLTRFDPFYLLWVLSLQAVRNQWRRVILMQTNREDVAGRYLDIKIPLPKTAVACQSLSQGFREYFTTLASAKMRFTNHVNSSGHQYITSIFGEQQEEPPSN